MPDCNVEIKECHLEDEDEELSLYSSDSDNQESNAEGASEESDDSDDLPPLETCWDENGWRLEIQEYFCYVSTLR